MRLEIASEPTSVVFEKVLVGVESPYVFDLSWAVIEIDFLLMVKFKVVVAEL